LISTKLSCNEARSTLDPWNPRQPGRRRVSPCVNNRGQRMVRSGRRSATSLGWSLGEPRSDISLNHAHGQGKRDLRAPR